MKEIAADLDLSVRTVENHQGSPASGPEPGKLLADLVRFAIKQHIVPGLTQRHRGHRRTGRVVSCKRDLGPLQYVLSTSRKAWCPRCGWLLDALACGRAGMTDQRSNREWETERDTTTGGARRGSPNDGCRAA